MKITTISTTINGCPIDYTLEFSYNSRWLDLYVEELNKEFSTKNGANAIQVDEIDLFDYAIDMLTEEIENDLHLWLIDNSNDAYFHSKGLEVFCNKEYYMTCESEEGARRVALELNLEEYG